MFTDMHGYMQENYTLLCHSILLTKKHTLIYLVEENDKWRLTLSNLALLRIRCFDTYAYYKNNISVLYNTAN